MPLQDGSLVCLFCRKHLFNPASFYTALAARKAISRPWNESFSYTTQPWRELKASANQGCNWCFLIREHHLHRYSWELSTPQSEMEEEKCLRVEVWFEKPDPPQGVTLRWMIEKTKPSEPWAVYGRPGDNVPADIEAREPNWDISSPESFASAREAVNTCISTHPECSPPTQPQLPTRVVDCTDPSSPKLVDFKDVSFSPYTALSYVWGQAQPHSTSTVNVSSYHDSIPVFSLPATIQDAITSTHRLGFKYLWTDTLCIIQDSPADKANEISLMCSIYQNAAVTLIAASATKASDGFLAPSSTPEHWLLPAFWELPDSEVEAQMIICPYNYTPRQDIIQTRGWCLQERLLPLRTLVFSSTMLEHHCRRSILLVGNTLGHHLLHDTPEIQIPHIDTPATPIYDEPTFRLWAPILYNYTSRAITDPNDKLIALSGVAQVFQRHWPNSKYLAGLWSENFARDVLWWSKNPTVKYNGPYRAPSWSWASVDAKVDEHASRLFMAWIVPLWTLVRWEVVPVHEGFEFGGVKEGAWVEVEAVVEEVTWGESGGLKRVRDGVDVGRVRMDTREVLEGKGMAVAVAETEETGPRVLSGLVVVRVEGRGEKWRRVGKFTYIEKPPGEEGEDGIYEEWLEGKTRKMILV